MKKYTYREEGYDKWMNDADDGGEFYLASDVDARIAELEKALRENIAHDKWCRVWLGDQEDTSAPDFAERHKCNCSAARKLAALGP